MEPATKALAKSKAKGFDSEHLIIAKSHLAKIDELIKTSCEKGWVECIYRMDKEIVLNAMWEINKTLSDAGYAYKWSDIPATSLKITWHGL